ncbi:helix-turn-helix domain-containing protein [Brucella pseudintermedia]|uniref:helix-turn-helix domain-containing protein n=1 Tax=Brucella pseudintermedia TaxID=370111 RepID=UPI00366DB0FF|nr:helix-turn-helix domain-containing protein [Brucella pseudintermedia]
MNTNNLIPVTVENALGKLRGGDKLIWKKPFAGYSGEFIVGPKGCYYDAWHGLYYVEKQHSGGWFPERFVFHPDTAKRLGLTPNGKAAPVQPTAKMTAAVLDLLKSKGSLTALEAQGVLRCRSLSKRISELKRLGWSISRELKEDTTGQRYARYSLTT